MTKPTRKSASASARRVRKPRSGRFGFVGLELFVEDGDESVGTMPVVVSPTWDVEFLDAEDARRLASWLLRFCEWSDQREAKKRGKVRSAPKAKGRGR